MSLTLTLAVYLLACLSLVQNGRTLRHLHQVRRTLDDNADFLRRVLDGPPEVQAFVLEHWTDTHDVPPDIAIRGLNAVLGYRQEPRA